MYFTTPGGKAKLSIPAKGKGFRKAGWNDLAGGGVKPSEHG